MDEIVSDLFKFFKRELSAWKNISSYYIKECGAKPLILTTDKQGKRMDTHEHHGWLTNDNKRNGFTT